MATSEHDQSDRRDGEGRDRRSFIRQLGIAGGAAVTGLAGSAWAGGAPSKAPPKRLSTIARPVSRKTPDLGITGPVPITRVPDPSRTGPADTAQISLAPTRSISPSSRETVLRSLHNRLRLPSALQARAGEGGEVPTLPSGALSGMTRVHTLASAYVEGIVLTPTGCEFSAGTYRGPDPLTYFTKSGDLRPSVLDQRRLRVAGRIIDSDHDRTSIIWEIRTPGQELERLAYTLELHITPTEASHNFDREPPCLALNGEVLSFHRTRAGAFFAAVEMGGTAEGPHHRLHTSPGLSWGDYIPPLEFHWLKVMAV